MKNYASITQNERAATWRAPLVNPERITMLNPSNASSNRIEAP